MSLSGKNRKKKTKKKNQFFYMKNQSTFTTSTTEDQKKFEIITIVKILVQNLLIYIYLYCFRRLSWSATITTYVATLIKSSKKGKLLVHIVFEWPLVEFLKSWNSMSKSLCTFGNPTSFWWYFHVPFNLVDTILEQLASCEGILPAQFCFWYLDIDFL